MRRPPEDSEPIATIPVDQVVIQRDDHDAARQCRHLDGVGLHSSGSECGDSAILTVTAATVPNTAARPAALPVPELLGALLLILGAASVLSLRRATIR